MANNLPEIYDNLATLTDAGLPILKTLDSIEFTGKYKRTFQKIIKDVSEGKDLHIAMKERKIFPELDILMIKTGEISGNLPFCFEKLGNWHQFRRKMKRKMISGLIYPLAVIIIGLFLIPIPTLAESGELSVGNYFTVFFDNLFTILIPVAVIFLIYKMKNIFPVKQFLDYFVFYIPLLRSAVKNLSLGRFAFSFNIMYSAGVPIIEALKRSVNLAGNTKIIKGLSPAIGKAKKGEEISNGFKSPVPRYFIDLWQTGETSGQLDKTSQKLAETTFDQAEFKFSQFAEWLPKVIYGLIVFYLALKIIAAFTSIFQNAYTF